MIRTSRFEMRPCWEASSSSNWPTSRCIRGSRMSTTGRPLGRPKCLSTQTSSSQTTFSAGVPKQDGQGRSAASPARGGSSDGGGRTRGTMTPSTASQGKLSHSLLAGGASRPPSPTASRMRAWTCSADSAMSATLPNRREEPTPRGAHRVVSVPDVTLPSAPDIAGTRHLHSGKVRDLYELTEGPNAGRLLMVASDRISIFDFVLDTTIPDKGELLTRMSLWWFEQLADLAPNHVISTDVPEPVRGRAVVCERLDMYPVECVARGYLTGTGLIDYEASGEVCGIPLPPGLQDGSRLPKPIFTPATKADLGEHDENVSYDAVVHTVGAERADALRRLTLQVYARAEEIARGRAIILADTKLEFGSRGDSATTVLADEVLTP